MQASLTVMFNTSKIDLPMKWNDEISLETGIKKTLTWIDDNLTCLKALPMDYHHKP